MALALYHDLEYALADPHHIDLVRGVSAVLDERHMGLVLLPKFGREHVDRDTLPFAVDGLIVHSPELDLAAVDRLQQRGIPMLAVDTQHPKLSSVTIDDEGGAARAAEHLLSLGHRRFAFLTLPLMSDARELGYSIVSERLRGWERALESAGVNPASVVRLEAENAEERACAALFDAGGLPEDVTALLCMSDRLALGACHALRELGVRVPEDVSVVGFDDIPAAGQHQPGLTTVHQNAYQKGRLAAELVLRQPEVVSARLEAELVVRQTSAQRS